MSRVHELLQRKREDVAARKAAQPLPEIPFDDRRVRWSKNRFHVIAEIKRASLSAGSIRPDLRLEDLALAYAKAGVSAISVLTEEHYFGGSLDDLQRVRRTVPVPLLQKDFIIDRHQILEAKTAGADFVLLIARFLSEQQLSEFLAICEEIKINALVEITEEGELSKLKQPVAFLGVNSRDLETLAVDINKFESLRKYLPETFLIAESGINSLDQLASVIPNYNAALVGEHFLRSTNPEAEAKAFVDFGNPTSALNSSKSVRIKICGITNEKDAMAAVEAGADALGFIFAESPRRIDPETLLQFKHRIPAGVLCVGVFRGQTRQEVESIARQFGLDIAQVYDPMDLPFPVWRAKTFSGGVDLQDVDLVDLKLEGESLKTAWQALSGRSIFALAGNLHPGNVAEAIALCHPNWVDVARGVESAPGIKDPIKLREFISLCSL